MSSGPGDLEGSMLESFLNTASTVRVRGERGVTFEGIAVQCMAVGGLEGVKDLEMF